MVLGPASPWFGQFHFVTRLLTKKFFGSPLGSWNKKLGTRATFLGAQFKKKSVTLLNVSNSWYMTTGALIGWFIYHLSNTGVQIVAW